MAEERAASTAASHELADLTAARAGDMDALERLLVRAGKLVRARLEIQFKWRAAIDVDDVMQVSYMEAFTHFDRFANDSLATFGAWLLHIAQKNLRDAVRSLECDKRPQPEKRLQPASPTESYLALHELLGATSTTPSRVAGANETRQLIDRALGRMPKRYAEAVRLFDLERLDGVEVAKRMQCSRVAAFMLRARGRDRLRELLGSASKFLDVSS